MSKKLPSLIDQNSIGQRIQSIRKSFNCTMEDFGRLIGGTTKSAVYNWEHGKRLPNRESLELIAILGKTSIDFIVYGAFDEFLRSLFTISTDQYKSISRFYESLGHNEGFAFYERASDKTKQEIIAVVMKEVHRNKWSYQDTPHILDSFSMITKNEMKKREYIEKLPIIIKKALSEIKKIKLTDAEISGLLELIEEYLKN
ncbi:helix-turn-helix domain-containing protein [Enterococcus sp. DIV0187]|uniref:helix-turn-helix domain-containing protein n=1 Tax=Enterococcus sp. DIV0187 TaxID=2774644 RepID=UPI003F247EEB